MTEIFSRLLWRAENNADQLIDSALKPLGLSSSLLGTLRMIVAEPGISAAELARRADVRPQSIAYGLTRLHKAGYTEQHPHPVNGKIIGIHPTSSAVTALASGDRILRETEEQLLAELTAAERDELIGLLHKVVGDHRQRNYPGQSSENANGPGTNTIASAAAPYSKAHRG